MFPRGAMTFFKNLEEEALIFPDHNKKSEINVGTYRYCQGLHSMAETSTVCISHIQMMETSSLSKHSSCIREILDTTQHSTHRQGTELPGAWLFH